MNNFVLIKNIILNNFNINLYTFSDYSGATVSEETIANNMISLNNQETAIELAQVVSSFEGVKKIEIYDKDNHLLLEVAESL
jgi:NADH:ubiquinone oxidoreductase subunit K